MRKIKEVIRLKFEADLSHERIAAATGISKGAVTKYLRRAREVELGWPLPVELDDADAAPADMPPHSVLTLHLREDGPTKAAEQKVIAFFRQRTGA